MNTLYHQRNKYIVSEIITLIKMRELLLWIPCDVSEIETTANELMTTECGKYIILFSILGLSLQLIYKISYLFQWWLFGHWNYRWSHWATLILKTGFNQRKMEVTTLTIFKWDAKIHWNGWRIFRTAWTMEKLIVSSMCIWIFSNMNVWMYVEKKTHG